MHRSYSILTSLGKRLGSRLWKSAFKEVEKAASSNDASYTVTFTLDYSHYGKVENYVGYKRFDQEDVRFRPPWKWCCCRALSAVHDRTDYGLTGGSRGGKRICQYRAVALE